MKKYFFLFSLTLFCIASPAFAALRTWNGGTSTAWGLAANWTPANIPTAADDVVIPSGTTFAPSITGNTVRLCLNLTINSGATLTYNSGALGYLDVYGNISVAGTLNHVCTKYIFMNGAAKTLSATGNVSNCHIYFWSASTTTLASNITINEIYIYNSVATSLSLSSFTLQANGAINQYGTLNLNTGLFIDQVFGQVITAARLNHNTGTFMWDISAFASSGIWNVSDNDYYNIRFKCGGAYSIYLENFDMVNLTLGGSLTIDPSSTFVCNDALMMYSANTSPVPILLAGNWINNGTFGYATGTVTFNGGVASAQSIGGASATTFYNLTANHAGTGITLNQPTTVNGALTLTNGKVYTTATNLLTLIDNATSSSGSASSFVDGPMRKIGNDAFVFPVGDNAVWARIATTAPGVVTDAFTAQYYDAPYGTLTPVAAPNAYVSSVEHWILDRTAGASNVSVTLYWENGTRSGINTFTNDLHVSRYDGTTWQDHGNGAMTGSAAAGTITTSGAVTSFSPFTFASVTASILINPLPVELVSFSAILNQRRVDIAWETASETNNDFFTIEKSKDGVNFEELMRVRGAGNSTSILNYFDIDHSPWGGISYYRLKQTDFNGDYKYSSIVPVENSSGLDPGISIFPNPSASGGITYIALNDMEGHEVLVVLRDLTGKEVYSKVVISSSRNEIIAIDPEGKLAKGSYLATASSANNLYSKKLIIK